MGPDESTRRLPIDRGRLCQQLASLAGQAGRTPCQSGTCQSFTPIDARRLTLIEPTRRAGFTQSSGATSDTSGSVAIRINSCSHIHNTGVASQPSHCMIRLRTTRPTSTPHTHHGCPLARANTARSPYGNPKRTAAEPKRMVLGGSAMPHTAKTAQLSHLPRASSRKCASVSSTRDSMDEPNLQIAEFRIPPSQRRRRGIAQRISRREVQRRRDSLGNQSTPLIMHRDATACRALRGAWARVWHDTCQRSAEMKEVEESSCVGLVKLEWDAWDALAIKPLRCLLEQPV